MVMVMAMLSATSCGGGLVEKLDGTTWTGQRREANGVTVKFELNLLSGSDRRCTFKMTANGNVSNFSGTYTVSGSTLTLVLDKITKNTQFVVSGNQMTSEEDNMVLNKIEKAAKTEKKDGNAENKIETLSGTTWTGQREVIGIETGFELKFTGKSCALKIMPEDDEAFTLPGTYELSGSTLTFYIDGRDHPMIFTVKGNQMTSTSEETNIVLKKK
jgi:hypothetical protein